MRNGDMLQVIEGEYSGSIGEMVGVNPEGLVTVRFGGRWEASFLAHHLEHAPVTLWNLLAVPGWWDAR